MGQSPSPVLAPTVQRRPRAATSLGQRNQPLTSPGIAFLPLKLRAIPKLTPRDPGTELEWDKSRKIRGDGRDRGGRHRTSGRPKRGTWGEERKRRDRDKLPCGSTRLEAAAMPSKRDLSPLFASARATQQRVVRP
jgi:hypothetical protein